MYLSALDSFLRLAAIDSHHSRITLGDGKKSLSRIAVDNASLNGTRPYLTTISAHSIKYISGVSGGRVWLGYRACACAIITIKLDAEEALTCGGDVGARLTASLDGWANSGSLILLMASIFISVPHKFSRVHAVLA
jgi:hypothetical protein